ncbi:MAG: hypothetical protein M0Q41_13355 [Bacteroidales bacterium]|nr:hypothetical protein [Acholeplasmataceae bacterium]MCK9449944.1 hypothetical protein [Bacteroidales bacterium]
MKIVPIYATPNADTRSLKELDYDLVHSDTIKHIVGVHLVLEELANQLNRKGLYHDHTKIMHFEDFFAALSTGKTGEEFYKLDWWKLHLTERHHLNQSVPEDVNLLDVLEMIVDCVCAGKARSGEVYPINLSNELLQKALANTVDMLKKNIKVIK